MSIYVFQAKQTLLPHTSSPVALSQSKLEDLFAAIPFSDKERWLQNKLFLRSSRFEQSLFKMLIFTSVGVIDPMWFNRIDTIRVNTSITVRDLTGLIETWSMFQTFMKKHPREAVHMLISTQNR